MRLSGTFLGFAFAWALIPQQGVAQHSAGQTAIIIAFVTDTLGDPIEGAEVRIVGTSARGNTDRTGRVALLAVPPGRTILSARRMGYAEQALILSIAAGTSDRAAFRLAPVSREIDEVVVRAAEFKPPRYAYTMKYDGFYRRRANGGGTFLTREIIDGRNAQRSEDLLRMVAGVRIRTRGFNPTVQFMRCGQVSVYIDGIRSHDPFRDYFALSPLVIEAMEIYNGMAQVPPEFSPKPNDCAAIVVWTRGPG